MVYSEYEYLKNVPLIYGGLTLAALGALAIILVVLFVLWGFWHQRGLDAESKERAAANLANGPIPVPIAKSHQGDSQVFQAAELENAGSGSYRRGIDLEGNVLIQGNLKHVVVRSTKAFIKLDGNASECEFLLGPGSTFNGVDLSASILHIRGEGTAKVRNLERQTGISVEHFTLDNAADGQIASKDLKVFGSVNPNVKLIKGTWK